MLRKYSVSMQVAAVVAVAIALAGCANDQNDPSGDATAKSPSPNQESSATKKTGQNHAHPADAEAADVMPDPVGDDEERNLYLTPAGLYTEADIQANGNVTASQKFKGFKAKHELKPKSGDKICPVTMTKANPKCAWSSEERLANSAVHPVWMSSSNWRKKIRMTSKNRATTSSVSGPRNVERKPRLMFH